MIIQSLWDITLLFLIGLYILISIFVIWFMFRASPELRAKAGNLINRRKNYGIIDVKEKGKYISTKVISFRDELIEEANRAFLAPSDPKYTYMRNGLPYVIYDYANGLIPYMLEPKMPEFWWNPQMVKAAIVSVKAIAQANAIREIATFIKNILIVLVVLCVAIFILAFIIHGDVGSAKDAIIASIPKVIKT